MRTKEEIKLEIKRIDSEVSKLMSERKKLESELLNVAESLQDRIKAWSLSKDKKWVNDLFDLRKYPAVSSFFDSDDLTRYRRYEFDGGTIEKILNSFQPDNEDEDEYSKEEIINEIIENNLGGFTCDW